MPNPESAVIAQDTGAESPGQSATPPERPQWMTPSKTAAVPSKGKRPEAGSQFEANQADTNQTTAAEDEGVPLVERLRSWLAHHRQEFATYFVSTAIHAVLALVLGLIMLDPEMVEDILSMTVLTTVDDVEVPEELEIVDQPETLEELVLDSNPMEINSETLADLTSPADFNINDLEPSFEMEDIDSVAPVKIDFRSDVGGRSEAARAQLVKQFGGTAASEKAVASGLMWLSKHQNADGSWSFDHVQDETCGASCSQPGSLKNKMGATGMALLAFLGAGQTHEQGKYQETVKRAVNFLLNHMEVTADGGDLRGENAGHAGMYIQGLASIAICEAHALTKDRRLRRASQYAIQFIIRAQDPRGGGWRYNPRQAGDTSVVGWQLMALKSAQAAKIPVPPVVFQGVTHFLNHVQADEGAQYGYTDSQEGRPATTAVGLLCRMYLGWKRDNSAMKRGIAVLSKYGPLKNNMYFNYYATQVLHHYGGEEWTKWNEVMREQLVDTQEQKGHAEGSWPPKDAHGGQGGRLYMTCMAIMTLEVYYRHLPLYHRENIAVEF